MLLITTKSSPTMQTVWKMGFVLKFTKIFTKIFKKISLKIKFLIPLRLKAVFQLLYFEIRMAKIKDNMCWQFVGLGVLQIW